MPPDAQNQNPNQPVTPPEAGPAPDLMQTPQPAPSVPEANPGLSTPEVAPVPPAPEVNPMPPAPDVVPAQQPPVPPAPTPPVPEAQPQFAQPQPPQPGMQFAPPPKPDSNTLGIFGIVLAFFFWPAGLVCSILALKKHSNKALAIVGLVLNTLALLATLGIILLLLFATTAGVQSKAKDTKYTADINSLQASLEAVHTKDGAYPSLEELNSESWRQQHMSGISPLALSPNSSQTQLVSTKPTDSAYAYTPSPSGCGDNTTNPCKSFDLAYKTTAGTAYSVHSLN